MEKYISLREFAKIEHVSTEAVRKQFHRYEEQLAGHFIHEGRSILLDADAIHFLQEKRKSSAVVVVSHRAEEENEQLKKQVAQLQGALGEARARSERLPQLIEDKGRLEGRCEALEAQISDLKQQRDEALAKAEKIQNMTLWGFLRHRKEF